MADFSFWFFITLAFLFGAFLRLWLILDQILLNDEWHGMYFVRGCSFTYLLTHFGPTATCIPMNIYRYVLLNTVGWNEILMRLPAIIPGIASLVVFPMLLRNIFSRRATIIFAFLLACSPFLIFYSRVCRPYSMVMFLGFLSVLASYFWAIRGERKYAFVYVVAGILAVYFHLLAVIAVLASLGSVIFVKCIVILTRSPKKRILIIPRLSVLTCVAAGIILLLSILILPSLIISIFPTFLASGDITLKSWVGFGCMLSGTANKFMVVLFLGLLGLGQAQLLRKVPLLGCIFLSVMLLYLGTLTITRPEYTHAPIVISRYIIIVFPLSFTLVAFGMDTVLNHCQWINFINKPLLSTVLCVLAVSVFLTVLFWSGPLITLYTPPNNFTNHSAFQESYELSDWDQSYIPDVESGFCTLNRNDIPSFYHQLAKEPDTTIIEYPMTYFDQLNLYYYYQQFHKKKVLAGYLTELPRKFPYKGIWIDDVLALEPDKNKLMFRNMIDLSDIDKLRQSEAKYVILHKNNIAGEWSAHDFRCTKKRFLPLILEEEFTRHFGQPIFEDHNLIVFRILREGAVNYEGVNT